MSGAGDLHELARWVAADIADGSYVNLGIGAPMLVAEYLPQLGQGGASGDPREIILHTENGMLGLGPKAPPGQENPDLINAGKQPVTLLPGGAFFHHADSFAMIRGGHIDITILGAYQVSSAGDIANWSLPGPNPPAVGGAMDLVAGAREVWAMLSSHTTRDGEPRIVSECTLPLTGARCVTRIYSPLGMLRITDRGLELAALYGKATVEQVRAATGAPLLDTPDQG